MIEFQLGDFTRLALGLVGFFSVLFVLVFLMTKMEQGRKRRQENPKKDAHNHWERVPGGMERIEVAGGWIYRDYIGGHSITLTFVPFPKDEAAAAKARADWREEASKEIAE